MNICDLNFIPRRISYTVHAYQTLRKTEAYVYADFDSNPKNPPNDDECVCGIEDYNDRNVASWRTNCPSGCAIYDYLNEVEEKLNDDWGRLEAK